MSEDGRLIHLPLNPEGWAMGPLSIGKKNGKFFPKVGRNQQLHAYKEAVADLIAQEVPLPAGEYELYFWFWKQLDSYETESGKRHQRHLADATNLQKATEDALQGVLIDNDRHVRKIGSTIVEQGPNVVGQVLILAKPFSIFDPHDIPAIGWEIVDGWTAEMEESQKPVRSYQDWDIPF
jgi:Holliday junction resolvase RusA-like endonuclease